ncbi:MAG TPA: ABC transporter permease [Candidatus Acidoferrum sp.]|nr:ABC transporter permease [Candidatus Acidoferrum sp.]
MTKKSLFNLDFEFPKLTYRLWKVWRRNLDAFMKTYKVNFVPPLLEPILYLLAIGFGFGALVSSSSSSTTTALGGVHYIQFIAPALVSIAMMYGSFFECTYGSFVRMYYQKTFDGIIATPVSVEEVIAGELLWGATRSVINSTIVLAVVAAFGLISSPLAILVIFLAFLVGLMFSSLGICFTALAPNIDFFNYPGFLFITPMFLLSGTFFPLTILPKPVQIVAQAILPLTHAVSLTRALILGPLDVSLLLSLAWILAVTFVFFIVSINLMKKRLIR